MFSSFRPSIHLPFECPSVHLSIYQLKFCVEFVCFAHISEGLHLKVLVICGLYNYWKNTCQVISSCCFCRSKFKVIHSEIIILMPFRKKRWGYCERLCPSIFSVRLSVHHSVTISLNWTEFNKPVT